MNLVELLEKVTSGLGPRMGLVGILPTTVFVLFVLILYLSVSTGQAPAFANALDQIAQFSTVQIVLIGIGVFIGALLVHPMQLYIVRLLEGYWGDSRLAVFISRRLTEKQEDIRKRNEKIIQERLKNLAAQRGDGFESVLSETGDLAERNRKYFPKDVLLPTQLGNVLRAAERNGGAPYGLDSVVIWPRLYAILPERTSALVDDQRLQLDLSARLCAMFLLATPISAGIVYYPSEWWSDASQVGGAWWWLAIPPITLLLAWFSYRGAIASALAYGEGIRTAIDLHRFDLLRALHLPLPDDREREKQVNTALCDFLRQGIPLPEDFRYDHEFS